MQHHVYALQRSSFKVYFYYAVISRISYIPGHNTLASSECAQLLIPSPLWVQFSNVVSLPKHCISSNQMIPFPLPKIAWGRAIAFPALSLQQTQYSIQITKKNNKSRPINTKVLVGFHLSFTVGKSKLPADDCRVSAIPLVITNCSPVVGNAYLHSTLICCCAIDQPHRAICALLYRSWAHYTGVFTVSTVVVPNSTMSTVFEIRLVPKTGQVIKKNTPSPRSVCRIANRDCSCNN